MSDPTHRAPDLSNLDTPEGGPEGQVRAVTRHEVVCPECGTVGLVTPNRRDASDFCAQCDFPLFWTPAAVELDRDQAAATEALRRLPGTGGRLTVASVACPTCAEENPVGATTCLRCGGPMVLPLPEPEPAPVVVAPPPAPAPAPEPPSNPWWWWLVGIATLVALVALVVVLAVQ